MKIRIGQIGVGAWGRNLLRNFCGLPEAQVVLACDIDPEVPSRLGPRYPEVRWTRDPREVLLADLDAVVIATPPSTHYLLAKEALRAGKHVFVEKPMTLSVEEGEDLVRLAEDEGRVLMVGHLMEYHPGVIKLKEYIDRGELGDIYYLYAARLNLGKVRREENALWSFAPHDISMALMLLGRDPLWVTAVGQSYLQDGIEDVVFLTLHFPGKVMAQVHVSWLDPHKVRRLTVVGSRKMAVFDDTEPAEMLRIYDKGIDAFSDYRSYGEAFSIRWGDIVIPKVPMAEPLALECAHFLECVRYRRPPKSDGRDGLRVLRVVEACQRSLERRGAPVGPQKVPERSGELFGAHRS
ncbi:MAG TPA: Gfo/Idh/MocA family oxidoreductase [Candidatus Latescibacteria bacterium]|nr:Gfo/Idh/MocA family oxidoreductase [Candidatus Latescibacterota bacterium]